MLFDRSFDLSTSAVTPVQVTGALQIEIEQFMYREARLLDTRDFDGWLTLWAPGGMYWIPREPDQANPYDYISLFWEDDTLREVRVRRLTNARNWSQQPVTRTARVVGNVMIDGMDAVGRLIVHSTFHLTEWRKEQRQLAGRITYKLESDGTGGRRIFLKRVDLVNCGDVFGNLEIFV
jgi:ethylbenzene dioxygenase beta subunit